MKKIAAAFLAFLLVLPVMADQIIPLGSAYNLISQPLTIGLAAGVTVTNSGTGMITGATNVSGSLTVYSATQHTIHIYNTGTNNAKVTLERTLDGTNWFNLGTNTVNAGINYETNFIGKWWAIQARCYVSNSPIAVLYMGGR